MTSFFLRPVFENLSRRKPCHESDTAAWAILPVPSSLRQVVVLGHCHSAFPCRALDRGRLSHRSGGSWLLPCRLGTRRIAKAMGMGHQARRCPTPPRRQSDRAAPCRTGHERLFTFLSSTTVVHSRGSDAPDPVLFLCLDTNAARSTEVEKQWRSALELRGLNILILSRSWILEIHRRRKNWRVSISTMSTSLTGAHRVRIESTPQ